MRHILKIKEGLDEEYYLSYLAGVEKIKTGEVTPEQIQRMLLEKEKQIDEWSNDSEFFDTKQAQTLLGWSEAIMQDLASYSESEKWDLLGAVYYFDYEDDVIPDDDPLCGLDDDYKVMKRVLEVHGVKLI